MLHLNNVSLEASLGIARFLVFILFFIIGAGAWVFYFSTKDYVNLHYSALSWENSLVNEWEQDAIAARWADPNYRVEDKLRRTPFTQERIDGYHQEALNMISSGADLNRKKDYVSHIKIRKPLPKHVIDRHHIEALKMVRRGKYD